MHSDLIIADIFSAARRIAPYVQKTPIIRAHLLEALFGGAEIWLKAENLQVTGSFKVRGVANKLLSLTKEQLQRGVTAASSGNHAQAVGYMSQKFGAKAVIVMPENAPKTKVEGAKSYGAQVVLYGYTGEDRDFKCDALIREHNYTLVHSHTDLQVIAGHATAAVEAYEQMGGCFDEIVLPCGAGSLTSGAAFAMKHIAPNIRVTAVEPEMVPRFTESLKAGHPVTVETGQTIADGLRVAKAEEINFRLIRDNVDNLITIDEQSIAKAVSAMALRGKITAEPSGCVGLAAALAGKLDMRAGRRLCFIVTGGNVDAELYARLLNS